MGEGTLWKFLPRVNKHVSTTLEQNSGMLFHFPTAGVTVCLQQNGLIYLKLQSRTERNSQVVRYWLETSNEDFSALGSLGLRLMAEFIGDFDSRENVFWEQICLLDINMTKGEHAPCRAGQCSRRYQDSKSPLPGPPQTSYKGHNLGVSWAECGGGVRQPSTMVTYDDQILAFGHHSF